MNRRKFLFGAGVTGTALATGTGAFTAFRAERSINVEVVQDENMLVGLQPGESNPEYVSMSEDGQVSIDLTSDSFEGDGTGSVGANTTVYIEDILTIANQSDSTMALFAEFFPGSTWFPGSRWFPGSPWFPGSKWVPSSNWLFVGTGENARPILGQENSESVEPGSSRRLGLSLQLGDVDPGEYSGTIRLNAIPGDSSSGDNPPGEDLE
jgi:hypothetical protein